MQMIFALSPQAKGRVERAAGTFQDRLITEIRLAGANSIGDARVVLEEFIVRFNECFAVSSREPDVAYRPVGKEMCLESAPMLQAQSEGSERQHGEVPCEYASAAAWQGQTYLRRREGGCTRGTGRSADH